jgi:hypothetical protein
MKAELTAPTSLSQQLFRNEQETAYNIGIEGILTSQPSDINGIITLLQALASARQLKTFLDKEKILLAQIEQELTIRKHEKELKG